MAKYRYYVLIIPTEDLLHATDMLRYDSCYKIDYKADTDHVLIHCLHFTPDRWKSFDALINVGQINTHEMTATEYNEAAAKAHGFLDGIRFAQKWIFNHYQHHHLVEDHG